MKLKKLLLPLVMPLITFFVLMIIGTNIGVNKVDAQGTGLYNEPWTPAGDQQTSDAYSRAIHKDNCATPSLECLVHQIFQFTAIEWVNSIVPMHGAEPTTIPTTSSSGNTKNSTTIAGVGGAVNGLTYLMGQMYAHPVARTSTYVADVLQNAHIITPAYAQGLGFASLNPILNLWKAFRNIAYMLFVFIFVAIGFMIMFRQKIGGQSAVTAQQAIPNVITSLIFVTFSYAIAGFLIDLMYLTMFMIIGLFAQTTTNLDAGIIDFNIIEIATKLFVAADFNNNIDIIKNMTASLGSGAAAANVVGLIGGITLSLVIAIAVLIGTFKLFFELLKSYANVVLSVVTAPIVLLGGALPGKNAFTPWIKNIIGNLSAFPTVLLVIILFYQFTNNTTGATTTGGFLPPFLLGRGQSGAIASLMGLAIILALPEIVKDVKTKLGATEGFGTMIFNAATSRAKEGFPLGGRIGFGATGAGIGTGVGAIVGAGIGTHDAIEKARSMKHTGASKSSIRKTFARNVLSGVGRGMKGIKYTREAKDGTKTVHTLGGLRKGAELGVRSASDIATSSAMRQPDILNPVTRFIDRIDPKTAKKEKKMQETENIFDMLDSLRNKK